MQIPQPINSLNELAKERNRAAAERTLLSWIRRCLSLITFGVAIDQIYAAVNRTFPSAKIDVSKSLTATVSLTFIVLSIVLMMLAMVQHYLTLKTITLDNYLNSAIRPLNIFITISTTIFGILAFIAVLIKVG
jgi:putative membrane protein